MATIASPSYALSAVMAVVGGFGIDHWVRRGGSVNAAHNGLLAIYSIVTVITMVGMALLPIGGSISCLYAYQFFGGTGITVPFRSLADLRWDGRDWTLGRRSEPVR